MDTLDVLARQASTALRSEVDALVDTEAALAELVRADEVGPRRRSPGGRRTWVVAAAAMGAAAAVVLGIVVASRSGAPEPVPPAASTAPSAPVTTAPGSPVTISISAPITVDPDPWSPPSETVVVADDATSSWSIGAGPQARRLAYPDGYRVGAVLLGPAGVLYVAYEPTTVEAHLPMTLLAYRIADMAAGRLAPVVEKELPFMDGPPPTGSPTVRLNHTRALVIRGEEVWWESTGGSSTDFRLVEVVEPGSRAVVAYSLPPGVLVVADGQGIGQATLAGTTRTHAVFVADIPGGRGLVVVDAQGAGRIVRLPEGARESSLSVDETGVVVAEVSGDQWRLTRLRLED